MRPVVLLLPIRTLSSSTNCPGHSCEFAVKHRGRCFKAVDLLPSRSQGEPSTRVREAMIIHVLHCPYCQRSDIVRHGLSPEGKQRNWCRTSFDQNIQTNSPQVRYPTSTPVMPWQGG